MIFLLLLVLVALTLLNPHLGLILSGGFAVLTGILWLARKAGI